MIYIVQNIFPILAATMAGLTIGLVWVRASGGQMPSARVLLVGALAEFWLAAILAGALILAPSQAGAWTMALGSAFIIWVGFVMPVFVVTLGAGGVKAGRIASVAFHWLVVMLAQAAIMQAIGVTAPPAA